MAVEHDLIRLLESRPNIVHFVADRIFYGGFPPEEPTLPAIVIRRARVPFGENGGLNGGSDFANTQFEVRLVAETFDDAITAALYVEAPYDDGGVDGFNGQVDDEGIEFSLDLLDQSDDPQDLGDASGQFLPARVLFFECSYHKPAPPALS